MREGPRRIGTLTLEPDAMVVRDAAIRENFKKVGKLLRNPLINPVKYGERTVFARVKAIRGYLAIR